jgi:hypothetical protein
VIDRWAGVSCDGGCGATSEILETAFAARQAAEKEGWTVAATDTALTRPADYCPACTAKRAGGTR